MTTKQAELLVNGDWIKHTNGFVVSVKNIEIREDKKVLINFWDPSNYPQLLADENEEVELGYVPCGFDPLFDADNDELTDPGNYDAQFFQRDEIPEDRWNYEWRGETRNGEVLIDATSSYEAVKRAWSIEHWFAIDNPQVGFSPIAIDTPYGPTKELEEGRWSVSIERW